MPASARQSAQPRPSAAEPEGEPSIGELFSKLGADTSTLLRHEMNLAVVEMGQKARDAAMHARLIAMGAGIAAVGALTLVAALILGLSKVLEPWLAALIVGFALAVAGYAVSRTGAAALRQMSPRPLRTMETWKDNQTWAKALVR